MMARLFEKIKIRGIEFRNRIVVSPMCQYSSEDGFANDWHFVHLGTRAVGGAALVITEATAVLPEGRISPNDLGIWKDEHIDVLKKITTFIKAQGAVAGTQLAHAGRKASVAAPWLGNHTLSKTEGGWTTNAPSPVPFRADDTPPHELAHREIDIIVKAFADAALRALKAGFEVIEIHAAHGYLINEFLSPLTNQRTDEYGGSFENRIRFLLQIISAIRSVWTDHLPLFVRISSTDWTENGWTIDDSVRLASSLKDKGIDLIDCSSGGNIPNAKIKTGPMYQVPFAERVKKESGILTGAVGIITTSTEAEEILADGKADIIVLARELLRDPYFPLRAARELGAEITWPVQYERARL